MHVGLHVTCLLFLSDFNETESSLLIFGQYSDTKFGKNVSRVSRVVLRGRTDRHDEPHSNVS
jgi:hypothetical protein